MMRVKANATNLPVRTPPMAASPISGDDSGKGLIESAQEPTFHRKWAYVRRHARWAIPRDSDAPPTACHWP